MPIESFLEYIRYEKNLSTHTVLSYRNDLFQFKSSLKPSVMVLRCKGNLRLYSRMGGSFVGRRNVGS